MNKETITVIAFGLILAFGFGFLFRTVPDHTFGLASTQLDYTSSTNSNVSCPGGTSTQVVAAAPERQSFIATWNPSSTVPVSLCRAPASCTTGATGIVLTTSSPRFEQTDGYKGAYFCIGTGATTTIGVSTF